MNRYLAAPDPIILHYLINPGVPPPERPSAWDVEVKMEDSALKHRMAVTVATSKESAQTLVKIDEEVSVNVYSGINNLLNHSLFLDIPTSSIFAQFAYEADVPGEFRERPGTIHPDLVGVPIAGFGMCPGQWTIRGTDCETRGIEAQ